MWDRKVIKSRGKAAFTMNYWRCVLTALILALVATGTSPSGYYSLRTGSQMRGLDSLTQEYSSGDYSVDSNDLGRIWRIDDLEGIGGFNDPEDLYDIGDSGIGGLFEDPLAGVLIGVFMISFMISMAVVFLLDIFLLNPLEVGCRRYFLSNSYGRGDIGEVGHAFQKNYGNVIKVMFFRGLFIFLWSLLLTIPGIIKKYEYRMVPYLLAEDPDMNWRDALKKSSDMMYGNKWNAFVLDLSFIGWGILSGLTLGILGLFYVDPYIAATDAELYKVISGRVSGYDDGTYVNTYDYQSYNNSYDGEAGHKSSGEDIYITFEEPEDTSTYD